MTCWAFLASDLRRFSMTQTSSILSINICQERADDLVLPSYPDQPPSSAPTAEFADLPHLPTAKVVKSLITKASFLHQTGRITSSSLVSRWSTWQRHDGVRYVRCHGWRFLQVVGDELHFTSDAPVLASVQIHLRDGSSTYSGYSPSTLRMTVRPTRTGRRHHRQAEVQLPNRDGGNRPRSLQRRHHRRAGRCHPRLRRYRLGPQTEPHHPACAASSNGPAAMARSCPSTRSRCQPTARNREERLLGNRTYPTAPIGSPGLNGQPDSSDAVPGQEDRHSSANAYLRKVRRTDLHRW